MGVPHCLNIRSLRRIITQVSLNYLVDLSETVDSLGNLSGGLSCHLVLDVT